MIDDQTSFTKPYVIVIAGYVGSGKSTIAVNLSKALENAPVLVFDHYEKYIEWPQDMNQWMNDGAEMYMVGSRMVQQKADIVVDGLKTVNEITTDILNAIKDIKGE